MIKMDCSICGDILVKSTNYPNCFIGIDNGVGICDNCWKRDVPTHISVRQREKYLKIEYKKKRCGKNE